jgi:hypothetical protein
VNRRTKQVGIFTALLAMIIFGTWPFWKVLYLKTASPALRERTRSLADSQPKLKQLWDAAMEDEVLTESEAHEIIERAGEKVDDSQ